MPSAGDQAIDSVSVLGEESRRRLFAFVRRARRPVVYEPTGADLRVSIPERRHEALADLLLQAILTEHRGETAELAALRTARPCGHALGTAQREQTHPGRMGAERGLRACERMLERRGFEPVRESLTRLRLRNCPFQPFAAKAPDLVCGMNHAFVSGHLQAMEITGVEAVLAPRPGECRVELCPAQPNRER